MHLGLKHQMLRRRGVVRTPNKRLVRVMDALAYLASFTALFFTLDQVRIIWVEHATNGVSLLAWVCYVSSALVWFCYGVVHRERVIMVVNFLGFCIYSLVVIGVLVWR